MMKRLMWACFAPIALALFFTSCDKKQDETMAAQSLMRVTAEDAANSETTCQRVEADLDEDLVAFRHPGATGPLPISCATIITTQPMGTFPNSITIDYGTGCTGPHGHVRSGQILVNISGPWGDAGSVRDVTFNNYSIDDVAVTGNITVTSNGADAAGCLSFTRVASITLTFDDGTSRSWTTNRTRNQIDGCGTETHDDDVWSVTGSSSGINRNGVAFTATIIQPLIKANTCHWIESGTTEFAANGHTRLLDFGSTGCDRDATMSIDGAAPFDIQLRH